MLPPDRSIKILLLLPILIFYIFLLARPIDLATADLGRYLQNGKIFFDKLQISDTNLYSYSHPGFSFINHHWAAGIIFFLIHAAVGFKGVQLFSIAVSAATLLIFLLPAWRRADLRIAAPLSILIVPLLATRGEMRPEVFSYFFSALFFWIIWSYQNGRASRQTLFILPLLELLWVNIHIYFFLGGAIVSAFILENLFYGYVKRAPAAVIKLKNLILILGMLGVSVLINPAGLKGALYPLNIFKNYGYRLFENQTFWFITRLFPYPPALFFEIALAILVLSWIYVLIKSLKKQIRPSIALLLLSMFFGAIALKAVRNFTIFGYFMLGVSALNFPKRGPNRPQTGYYFSVLILMIAALAFVLFINPPFWENQKQFGLGLEPGINNAAEFFQREKLRGPVLNNYDNGGYLIYHLYPKERVFVDNRPEAYPADFFEKIYIPMLEDDAKWKEEEQKYNFNAIFFSVTDLTPWGQKFLVSRVSDPDWAPVFADRHSIIFLKRNEVNRETIARYELPKNKFNIKN